MSEARQDPKTAASDPNASTGLERDDPIALFAEWFELAGRSELRDHNAMSLATVDAEGLPDVRTVLLKHVDEHGFVFFTNTESAKGRQLADAPRAALCFHWRSIGRQVRVRGAVTPVTEKVADDYFASRPRDSRIGAWASAQSRPLDSRRALEAEVERQEKRFAGADVPRPASWSGYVVAPDMIEFWVERHSRLHDRVVFTRGADGGWTRSRLYP